MSLIVYAYVNTRPIGMLTIQRQEHLDLSDKDVIADAVCTYKVFHDGRLIGKVKHRYGDGAWVLVGLASKLAEKA